MKLHEIGETQRACKELAKSEQRETAENARKCTYKKDHRTEVEQRSNNERTTRKSHRSKVKVERKSREIPKGGNRE